MDLVKEYYRNSTFKSEEDFFESLKEIFMFGTIKSEYKNNSTIENKELINSTLVNFLQNLLSKDLINSKKDKLTVINFIDEFNFRNEILELIKEKNQNQNNTTSVRLGKKFMSSIENK